MWLDEIKTLWSKKMHMKMREDSEMAGHNYTSVHTLSMAVNDKTLCRWGCRNGLVCKSTWNIRTGAWVPM